MTIKTLEFIRRLLIDEEAKTKRDYKYAARRLQREYEESETASKDFIKSLEAAADKSVKVHTAAANALEDFESHEW